MNVYFRNPNKTLGKMKVDGVDSHEEAINLVVDALKADKLYTENMPVLTVFSGKVNTPKDAA